MNVSIRSPYRSKGRYFAPFTCSSISYRFNPLPLPKQGEMVCRRSFDVARCVSIRSPYRSQGEIGWSRKHDNRLVQVSIRSPYRSKGRCSMTFPQGLKIQVSIRSPYRSKGRCAAEGYAWRCGQVSIRSPYRSKGRSAFAASILASLWFQSAPLTEARGDARTICVGETLGRFNPLPLPKQGEIPGARFLGR